MSKDNTKHQQKVPKLRFKEFNGEWREDILGNIGQFIGGGTPYTGNTDYWNGNNLWVSSSDIHEDSIFKIRKSKYISDLAIKESATKLIPENSLLIVSRVGVGKIAINKIPTCTSQDFTNIIPTDNNYYIFLAYLLKNLTNKLMQFNQGTSIKGFTSNEFKKIKAYLPSLPEQEKIANLLVNIDNKIDSIKNRKELIEYYKKGILQKLFNQDIRFKDENGKEYGEWKELRLGSLSEIIVGGTPSTINEDFWNGKVPWLSSGELNNGYVSKTNKTITEYGLKKSAAKLMPINTVLLAMTGATLGRIGYLSIESTGNQSVAGFIPNTKYSSKFLFYTLQFGFNIILSFGAGAAQPGINKSTIENLVFLFPDKEEQIKIAGFLSSIDEKIENINNKLEIFNKFKKGLLQKMFV